MKLPEGLGCNGGRGHGGTGVARAERGNFLGDQSDPKITISLDYYSDEGS